MPSQPLAACCGPRPGIVRGKAIWEIPELAALAVPVNHEPGAPILHYVCSACGQRWEQHAIPMMHVDVDVLVKEGVTADLGAPPKPPAPPPPALPAGRGSTIWWLLAAIAALLLLRMLLKSPL